MAKKKVKRMDGYDVVIVGGGPCGCVLANDLTKAGKKVILIEKGGNNLKGLGSMFGMTNGEHMEKAKGSVWQKTIEGDGVVIGTGMGGGSYLYAGIVGMPQFEAFDEVGMDLRPFLEEAKRETWVSKTPDEFIGPQTRRMLEVCHKLGLPFEPAYRHIKFDKCEYGCTSAAFGCKRHAKWMGYYAANEAAERGATLQIYTDIKEVIVENGVAVGVKGKGVKDGIDYEIRGKLVVSSAGGLGSAMIARSAGIMSAGNMLFGDPSISSFALLPPGTKGSFYEHGTSISMMDDEHGCLFSTTVTWPRMFWSMYQLMGTGGIRGAVKTFREFPRIFSIFNKIHDAGIGQITWDGRVSKILTNEDDQKMNYCRYINTKIMTEMGCDPSTIHHTLSRIPGGMTFGHPGGTCSVGTVVNNKLETEVKNLFVCDISSLPGAPSRPPVLTLVTLAKWFVPQLLGRLNAS
ncbi:GMC oxidoreductase [Phosphitispora sp. TUW77]|uniref:GMC oxidoreductase n=1 Tax=Phosphitispora sp. TUW77 TaxID=3152361 RepID=UPI003AB39FC4